MKRVVNLLEPLNNAGKQLRDSSAGLSKSTGSLTSIPLRDNLGKLQLLN